MPEDNLVKYSGKYSCVVVQTPKGCEATMHLDIIPSKMGSLEGKYFGMPHFIVYTDNFRHPGELIDAINEKFAKKGLKIDEIIELLEKDEKLIVDPRVRVQ